jgi:hypothetical protein
MLNYDFFRGFRQTPVVLASTGTGVSPTALIMIAYFESLINAIYRDGVGSGALFTTRPRAHLTTPLVLMSPTVVLARKSEVKKSLYRIITDLPSTVKKSYWQALLHAFIIPGLQTSQMHREESIRNDSHSSKRYRNLHTLW